MFSLYVVRDWQPNLSDKHEYFLKLAREDVSKESHLEVERSEDISITLIGEPHLRGVTVCDG